MYYRVWITPEEAQEEDPGTPGAPAQANPSSSPAARSGFWDKRPDVTTVADGFMYHTIDTMESYLAQDGMWVSVGSGGSILASSASTSPAYSSSDKAMNLPTLSATFTGGTRPVEISFTADFANSQVGGETTVKIALNGVDIMVIRNTASLSEKWETVSRQVVKQVENGKQYTVTARLERSWGSGTARISGSASEAAQVLVRQG